MNEITVLENNLGKRITLVNSLHKIISMLTKNQIEELYYAFRTYYDNWTPKDTINEDALFIGKGYDTLSKPLSSWVPSIYESKIYSLLDKNYITRLSLYTSKIFIWIGGFGKMSSVFLSGIPDGSKGLSGHFPFYEFLCKVIELRDLIIDNVVVLIPDKYYSDIVEWDDSNIIQSEILKLSKFEAKQPALREILDRFNFIPEKKTISVSWRRYNWAEMRYENIAYIDPINHINEDIAVQTTLDCPNLCFNPDMFELYKNKSKLNIVDSFGMVWENMTVKLPRIGELSYKDIYNVRKNEEAFSLWRNGISGVIRMWKNELDKGEELNTKEALKIFNEVTLPIQLTIEDKIKSKSLKTVLESGAVSFMSGALATAMINPEPLTAVIGGGISSSLKIGYDLTKGLSKKETKSLLNIYLNFENV